MDNDKTVSSGVSAAIANYFLDSCATAYHADLSTGTVEILKAEGLKSADMESHLLDFTTGIPYFIDRCVSPADRGLVRERLSIGYVRKALQTAESFTFDYRDISVESPGTYRGVVMRGEDENHVVVFFWNITGDLHRELEQAERDSEYRSLVENVAAMYNIVYLVNMADDSLEILKMDDNMVEKGADFANFSEMRDFFVNKVIHPRDRARIEKELSYKLIRRRLAAIPSYSVEYCIMKDGVTRWGEMSVTSMGGDRIAIGMAEKDLEIVNRHLQGQRLKEYFAMFVVDADSGMMRIAKKSQWDPMWAQGATEPYEKVVRSIGERLGDSDAGKFYIRLSDLDYVKKLLADEGKFTYSYQSPFVGAGKWVTITGRVFEKHEDKSPASFTLVFTIIDMLESGSREAQAQIKSDMELIGGIASEYLSLYFININEGVFKVYSLDGVKLSDTKKLVGAGGSPEMMFSKFGQSAAVHPDDRPLFTGLDFAAVRDRLAHSKRFSIRYRRNFNGEYRWCRMDVVKYEAVDEEANAIAVGFAECDAEIRAEQAQKRRLQEALAAAEAANRSKTSFLFNMSHDIRTPMNAIMGFTDIALKNLDDRDRLAGYLGKIKSSSSLLLTLINSVLDMSRVESGKATIEEKVGDVILSFVNIAPTMHELANEKGVRLTFSFGDVTDRFVFVDYEHTQRVFVNIISNAIKYSRPNGYVRVRCEQATPNVDGRAFYRYTFEDNGIGMSEDFVKHVFDEFSRERNSTTSGIQGTGLGMALCKAFVNLMGGTIECRSRQGAGTTFTVLLPFRIQNRAEYIDPVTGRTVDVGDVEKARAEGEASRGVFSLTGRRVLLVEDNEMNREVAEYMLEEQGLKIDTAANGKEAVEKVCTNSYDFVLMDIQMPVMDGYEATRRIRATGNRVPIIALSANAFAEDRAASLAAGMNEHVAKPIRILDLTAALAKFA